MKLSWRNLSRSKRRAALGFFFVLPLGGAPVGAEPPPAGPPSVLLLTLDTTRADALGAYGGREARTPVLDGLAKRGMRWARPKS